MHVYSLVVSLSLVWGQSTFTEAPIDPSSITAFASPFRGGTMWNLIIVQQIPGNTRKCFEESGSNPVMVNPLLMEFNFERDCHRGTDLNFYGIRLNGEDQGWKYLITVRQEGNELFLLGVPALGSRGLSSLRIGRTRGFQASGFMKIHLEPGWSFTNRVWEGKTIGHYVYLSYSSGATASGTETRTETRDMNVNPGVSSPIRSRRPGSSGFARTQPPRVSERRTRGNSLPQSFDRRTAPRSTSGSVRSNQWRS